MLYASFFCNNLAVFSVFTSFATRHFFLRMTTLWSCWVRILSYFFAYFMDTHVAGSRSVTQLLSRLSYICTANSILRIILLNIYNSGANCYIFPNKTADFIASPIVNSGNACATDSNSIINSCTNVSYCSCVNFRRYIIFTILWA